MTSMINSMLQFSTKLVTMYLVDNFSILMNKLLLWTNNSYCLNKDYLFIFLLAQLSICKYNTSGSYFLCTPLFRCKFTVLVTQKHLLSIKKSKYYCHKAIQKTWEMCWKIHTDNFKTMKWKFIWRFWRNFQNLWKKYIS